MKIIGRSKEGYIVDISKLEMTNLLGYTNLVEQLKHVKIEIGDVVEVSKLFEQVNYLAKNYDRVAVLAGQLMDHAEKLVLIDPVHKELEKTENGSD